MTLVLRELTAADEEAFFAGFREWDGESPGWYSFAWKDGMTYSEMLEILRKEREGIELRPDRVRHTMLYAFVEGAIVGRLSVRHELNEHLRFRGGHIGYAVAPRFRRKGYASVIVRLGLPYCRQIGISSLMITCADDNEGSWKVIEKFGGVLADKVWDDTDQETIRRYWIQLN